MFFCITNAKKWVILLLLSFLITGITACFIASADSKEEITLPILMYHSVLKDPTRSGMYIVTPDLLEKDLQYLKEHQYQTITVSDVVSYVYDGKDLPERPVILTFDDGHYNNLTYLLPLLEKYDMKAVISVVGNYSEQFSQNDAHNPNYSYLTWEDISLLFRSNRIEIANHTYHLHDKTARKGCSIKKGEKQEEYQRLLKNDLQKLQDALQQKSEIPPPATFTYPFGYICNESYSVIKETGFLASLSCFEKVNRISRDPASLYCLGRFNRPAGIPTEQFMKKLNIS